MGRQSFEVMVLRQPGYGLSLSVKFTAGKATGVVSLSRQGWQDPAPASTWQITDVAPAELRGGRFTLINAQTERREGYSLARVTEALLAKISDTEWTPLEPITEFGFRYLQVPERSLKATPAAAAVRTRAPGGASGRARVPVSAAPKVRAGVPNAGARSSASAGGSLLSRARHSAGKRASAAGGSSSSHPASSHPASSRLVGNEDVVPTAVAIAVPVSSDAPVADTPPDGPSRRPLPPKPRPVAHASSSGSASGQALSSEGSRGSSKVRVRRPAPVAQITRATSSIPGSLPAVPTPVEASLADAALDGLTREDAVRRLRVEMQKVWDLHLRLEDVSLRLGASEARERDLLDVLGRWQERQTKGRG